MTHTQLPSRAHLATYAHSGACGDALYALAAIRRAGGGHLYLTSTHAHPSINFISNFAPLALLQPYIHSISTTRPTTAFINIDVFRGILTAPRTQYPSLWSSQFRAIGEPVPSYFPWLELPRTLPPHTFPQPPYTVINRTTRYQSDFDWRTFLAHTPGRKLFLGTPTEHAELALADATLEYCPTPNLLTAAHIIARATHFYGNASACWVIAQGLNVPRTLEITPETNASARFPHEAVLA